MPLDIALVRVDNRLVHGQILEAWVPFIKASCIVVADDEVAGDYFRETVIRMAVPREVELIISGVEEFARNYTYSRGQGKKTIVLFSSIDDAVKAFSLGFRFEQLNLGNIHHAQSEENGARCSSCVFLNDSDVKNIVSMMDSSGVQVELRRVPLDIPVDARDIVKV
ncbi:MAG: PTS sugar transporter subunit IIB [Syntrophales bacterium LBB04]|nr:PTS sugar transporter subunit IIB [Syntrophales bacterium LBB04]